jgi:hypothetical protein
MGAKLPISLSALFDVFFMIVSGYFDFASNQYSFCSGSNANASVTLALPL